MEKYAVFLDIDGTLYVDGKVPQKNIEALRQARAAGHYVFINTARSYGFLPKGLLDTVEVDGVVAGIGTDLRLGGKQIFSICMTTEELVMIAELFNDGETELIFEGEETSLAFNPTPHHREKSDVIESPDEFLTKYKGVKISKIFFGRDYKPHERAKLEKDYDLYQHATYSEFVAKGFSKAEGMKRMAEYIGVPVERCIAMGDSLNDSPMLEAAGISVAMGDGVQEVRDMCDIVTCDAKDGGVGEAVYKILFNKDNI